MYEMGISGGGGDSIVFYVNISFPCSFLLYQVPVFLNTIRKAEQFQIRHYFRSLRCTWLLYTLVFGYVKKITYHNWFLYLYMSTIMTPKYEQKKVSRYYKKLT